MTRSNIYQTRPTGVAYKLSSWIAFLIVGVLMGVVAFVIDIIAEHLVLSKWDIT